jgi:hypothetical protein
LIGGSDVRDFLCDRNSAGRCVGSSWWTRTGRRVAVWRSVAACLQRLGNERSMSVSSFPPALRASRSPHLPIYLGAWFSYIQDLPRGGRLSPWTTTHLYVSQSGLAWPTVVSFAWVPSPSLDADRGAPATCAAAPSRRNRTSFKSTRALGATRSCMKTAIGCGARNPGGRSQRVGLTRPEGQPQIPVVISPD